MLNNANLGETTLCSAKIQLINAAKSREVLSINRNYLLDDKNCDDVKSLKKNLLESLQIFQSAENEGENITSELAMDGIKTAKEEVKKAMEIISKVLNKTEPDSAQEQTPTGPQKSINLGTKRLSIYLDDAINVLQSLQQGPSTKDSELDRNEVQNIVNKALLSRKSSFCQDCGSTDHFRGNLSCKQPSHFTIVLRERKKEKESRMELHKEDDDSEITH